MTTLSITERTAGKPARSRLLLLFSLAVLSVLVTRWTAGQPAAAAPQALVVRTSPAAFSDGLLAYLAPLPGARLVSPDTTIALRPAGPPLSPADVTVQATGRLSGAHPGRTILAGDRLSLIFIPDRPFAAGEAVDVAISLRPGGRPATLSYAFQVAQPAPAAAADPWLELAGASPAQRPPDLAPSQPLTTTARYFTVPADFPIFDVYSAPGRAAGYLFLAYFATPGAADNARYLLILDDNGQPVFYQPGPTRYDFKKQPNGLLTYYDTGEDHFVALDDNYAVVDSYQAGNGYDTDVHDLLLLDNGHVLLMIYDAQQIDMSQITPGGDPNAVVIGCIVQELDGSDNVVFEWRSWDHISILDTNQDPTGSLIDYVHCNSLEQDYDGHILMSSRNLDEVTKINRQTGQIIWRMGGNGNQFDFTNDAGFAFQHDARRLANGHLTIFDNRAGDYSRGVEYVVDEINMDVTRVWEYQSPPGYWSWAMGSHRRLPNSNAILGWGSGSNALLTEVQLDGTRVFELIGPPQHFSYRAFRFPWQGYPTWPPAIFARQVGATVELYFSWNGATELGSFDIYAGPGTEPTQVHLNVPAEGFETRFDYLPDSSGLHAFRVVPRDVQGQPGPASPIFWLIVDGQPTYLPLAHK